MSASRSTRPGRPVDHARARERHVLPRPGRLRMVALEALQRVGERSGAAGRAQPHVDLVERALVGVGGERRHDLGAEPRVVLDRRQRLAAVRGFQAGRDVVDEDQVEVGGGRHLAAAELAHAQHGQPLAAEAAMRLGEALLDAVAQRRDGGGGDVGIGEPACAGRTIALSCCTPTWKRRSLAQRRARSRMSCSCSTSASCGARSAAISGAARQRTIEGGRQHRIEQHACGARDGRRGPVRCP